MASFFRKRIAQRIIPLLRNYKDEHQLKSSVICTMVKVSQMNSKYPQLVLSWEHMLHTSSELSNMNPSDLVRLLRNQGLPTAEGFIDIELSESPLGIVFTVDRHVFSKIVLMDICINENHPTRSSCLFENIVLKKVFVECSAPSIGKKFTMSHFRSGIHSNFIANINKFAGHDVVTQFQLDDWGLAAATLVFGFDVFGMREELIKKPIAHLSEVMKASFREYANCSEFKESVHYCYKELIKGEEDTLSKWTYLRNLCVKDYDSIYSRCSIQFDNTLLDLYQHKNIQQECDNIVQNLQTFEKNGFMQEKNQERNGFIPDNNMDSLLYQSARVLAAIKHHKEKHSFDAFYHVDSSLRKSLFSTVTSLMEEMNLPWSNDVHFIKLKNNNHFCPKNGRHIEAEEILNKSKTYMLDKLKLKLHMEENDKLKESAELLGVSSLMIHDLKHRRNVDYPFCWEDALTLGKGGAASFQFLNAGLIGLQKDSKWSYDNDLDTSALGELEAHQLIKHLARFDEMVYKSYCWMEPCIIYQYLLSLWYYSDKASHVLKLDLKQDRLRAIKARLLLLAATQKVLQNALKILGIKPLETV